MTLLRWLGPWAAAQRAPRVSLRREPGAVELLIYGEPLRGESRAGVYVVTPGIHHQGPDDPRLDRFCRVLAAAGFVVVAPRLPDFLDLRVAEGTSRQLAPAFERAEALSLAHRLGRVSLFSISFGSMPALELAAHPDYRERVGRLVLFGGFCDFEPTIRHAVFGAQRDPLNSPVIFANLLWRLGPEAEPGLDRAAVLAAWRAMVEETWGRMELKLEGRRDPIAHAIAARLGARERMLFLAGCGLDDSARGWFEAALSQVLGQLAFTDPRPHLSRLRAPVTLVHGRDDDVIPVVEAEKLSAALGAHPHQLLLTGFYGHTGSALPSPRSLLGEARTMLSILRALSEAAAP